MISVSRRSQVFVLEIAWFSIVRILVFSSPFMELESRTISCLRDRQNVVLLAALNYSKYLRMSSYSAITAAVLRQNKCRNHCISWHQVSVLALAAVGVRPAERQARIACSRAVQHPGVFRVFYSSKVTFLPPLESSNRP